MNLKGVTLAQFNAAVATANLNPKYGGNLRVHQDAHETGVRKITTVGRLTVESSGGLGARTSWSGRKCQAACWHAFRDVIGLVFDYAPGAVVKTTMATYTTVNFDSTYPDTAYVNVGSQFQPVTMPELCDC